MATLTDEAIIYQLEKVDQGGEVMDLFEAQIDKLAGAWGFDVEEREDHPYYGYIRLPGNRYAGLEFKAVITERRNDLTEALDQIIENLAEENMIAEGCPHFTADDMDQGDGLGA